MMREQAQASTTIVQQPPAGPANAYGAQEALLRGRSSHKILRMRGIQVRYVIGKGGEHINAIRQRTGANISVKHAPEAPWGEIHISPGVIGNTTEHAVQLVHDILAQKGCPLPPDPDNMPSFTAQQPIVANTPFVTGWQPAEAEPDLEISSDCVALFIGQQGNNLREVKAKVQAAGGWLNVKVLEPQPNGMQKVVVFGAPESAQLARQLVKEKIMEVTAFHYEQIARKGLGKGSGMPATALEEQGGLVL